MFPFGKCGGKIMDRWNNWMGVFVAMAASAIAIPAQAQLRQLQQQQQQQLQQLQQLQRQQQLQVQTVTPPKNIVNFQMVVSAGAGKCLPNASANVTIVPGGPVENMTVSVSGLPPTTDFDFFVIQVPTAPFGMSWYQGDIETDSNGNGHATFVGRFSIETFVVAPGSTAAPLTFNKPPFPSASPNPLTGPTQMYHLGLWFNSPADAANAGCPNTVTPFNGEHNAGIQVLNTSNFPALQGPLLNVQ
jgi:hypothetical protein